MSTHTQSLHPTSIVIFGGTGDLAQTKLFPALLDLFVADQLPEAFHVIGLSRKDWKQEEYQRFVADSIAEKTHGHDPASVQEFCERISYVKGSFDDSDAYERVKQALRGYDQTIGQCTNKLFYLAVPPQYYEVIFEHLHSSEALALCDHEDAWARLLVEKPFGRDLTTAQKLERTLCSLFRDEQIYRIDHYLAKDAIENIFAVRFANSIMEHSWHGQAIESIHIRLLETKDVSSRGSFYDRIGTLRDVGQNHMLQIFALLTMPPADVRDARAVRSARAKALRALASIAPDELVRGQYEGYATTTGVAESSDTETYFKIGFTLQDEYWRGTRCVFEAGKALDRHVNEVVITFAPNQACTTALGDAASRSQNALQITFAPQQRMTLSLWTKSPGFSFALREQEFVLSEHPGEESASPEAYERVLYDCIVGDQTRFVSGEEIELAWQFITPILEQFQTLPLDVYPAGSEGPGHDMTAGEDNNK